MNFYKWMISCVLCLMCNLVFADPVITSISPSNGNIAGGNVVAITGTGFTAATNVDFGFRPATSYIVNSDTSISAIVPAGTAGSVDITVTAASATSAITRADLYTYTKISWDGILSGVDQDAITFFDTSTNTINGTIPLPADSLSSAITPDGTTIYSADSDVANINIIDVATNSIIGNIPTPVAGLGAFDIVISPDGTRLYVSNFNSGYVTVVDTVTNTVVTDILTAPNLGSISITPDGKTVYVVSFAFGTVTTIDTATNTVIASIPVGGTPGMSSITPDGTTAYVTSASNDTITIIDVATETVTGTINFPAGTGPYGSYILTNAPTMYVANIGNSSVSVVDLTTNTIVTNIPFPPGTDPFWLVATPNNQTVYVINETTDNVTPIDVATNTLGTPFANILGQIQDIEMSPDQAPVASFIVNLQPIASPTQFDASASISPVGTISTYAWDFGDGTTLVTNTPVVNHTYYSSGPFNVTLIVTNSAGTSIFQVFSAGSMSQNGGPTATLTEIIDIEPLPPTHVRGHQKHCHHQLVNVIKWDAPLIGTSPASYRIYRDAGLTDLIAVIPSYGPLKFVDCNRTRGVIYTYYLVSVSPAGTESTPVFISVP